MARRAIFCGEVRNLPPQDEGGKYCPYCGKTPDSLGEFNGYWVTQPVAPNTDLLMEELLNFERKRVLIVVTEVLSYGSEIPKEAIEEAVVDAKSCLDWYQGLINEGIFYWFNTGVKKEV